MLSLPRDLLAHTFAFLEDRDVAHFAQTGSNALRFTSTTYQLRVTMAMQIPKIIEMPLERAEVADALPAIINQLVWPRTDITSLKRLCGGLTQILLEVTSPEAEMAPNMCLPRSLTRLYVQASGSPILLPSPNRWTRLLQADHLNMRHLSCNGLAFMQLVKNGSIASYPFTSSLHSLTLTAVSAGGGGVDLRAFISLRMLTVETFEGMSPHSSLLLPSSLIMFRCPGMFRPLVDAPMADWKLPPELQTLHLNVPHLEEFDALPIGEIDWPASLTDLSLGNFGGRIRATAFPSTLRHLTSAMVFVEPSDQVCLPKLQSLTLSGRPRLSMRPELHSMHLPVTLSSLIVRDGIYFLHSTWPPALQRLEWQGQWPYKGYVAPRRLTGLPSGLTHLTLMCVMKKNASLPRDDQQLLGSKQDRLPALECLKLKMHDPDDEFDWPLVELLSLTPGLRELQLIAFEIRTHLPSSIPITLRRLSLQNLSHDETLSCLAGHPTLESLDITHFRHPLPQPLPPRLRMLKLDWSHGSMQDQMLAFNHSLDEVVWPTALRVLKLGFAFDRPMAKVHLPAELQELWFGTCFQQGDVTQMSLPPYLQLLSFEPEFPHRIDEDKLPPNCRLITRKR